MLKQRVITALVLLAILLPALFYPAPQPFILMTLVFIAAGCWEWVRMNGGGALSAWLAGLGSALLCAVFWRAGLLPQPLPLLWLCTGGAWVLLGGWVLRCGVGAWAGHTKTLRLALGLVALCVTWLAVAQARLLGVNFLLSVLALVWMADIAAYFTGRAFGGRLISRKLAASISPGKSWEGVFGGMVGVVLLAMVWRYVDAAYGVDVPSLYTRLAGRGLAFLLLACIFMAAMSVVGDLFESLVKRSAGVKDSSGLLPGHGGVLDRVDALLPALPLAMMLVSL
ncbi:MAG: phosphatidate cytidylyltransferase [Rhodoferax sp.]|nr:phosphatidate cytidylyltransferase [Rhodoferax sp.]OIP21341.1 MAG: phosphatidate cytidylyltransferase [Comamonadaceae bacterium CG2_30_60_41]PIW07544.1 MAG: phosphatidate cytidylyltransferase [Comamonadaceae bacterium CG17_big_fil_post_rev_8_21_14_2_50_60_13]PIY24078.1 MAG: phosphatidate cytidylyltransferase [Comamonadaceae bacterium CG_4_10_14_3_um_filter_60_75]PJC12489.1 MAG: phosphatidate cytidylyltransferase [Comamonadaceae bacterium CG_4_9_14_0_8_um_filter_60_18]